jgi:hypothetical protein
MTLAYSLKDCGFVPEEFHILACLCLLHLGMVFLPPHNRQFLRRQWDLAMPWCVRPWSLNLLQ